MIIYSRPIRSIGAFFARLSPDNQRKALALADRAHKMPKIDIERAVIKLEKTLDYTNFGRVH
jgi:hypothetical protein